MQAEPIYGTTSVGWEGQLRRQLHQTMKIRLRRLQWRRNVMKRIYIAGDNVLSETGMARHGGKYKEEIGDDGIRLR